MWPSCESVSLYSFNVQYGGEVKTRWTLSGFKLDIFRASPTYNRCHVGIVWIACSIRATECSSLANRGIAVCMSPRSRSSRGINADKSAVTLSGELVAAFRFVATFIGVETQD